MRRLLLLLLLWAGFGVGCTPLSGPRRGASDDDDAAGDDDDLADDDDDGDDDDDDSAAPWVAVEPPFLDFGTVPVGSSPTGELRVTNVGAEPLQLQDFVLSSPAVFAFAEELDVPTILEPGEATLIVLSFTPGQDGAVEATLILMTNDPSQPEAVVGLAGVGEAARIELSPPSFDFGNLSLGCDAELEVQISNIGSLPLTLSGLEFSDLAGSGEMALTQDLVVPAELAPGESRSVTVLYAPTDVEPDTAVVTVTSDDPQRPTANAQMFGIAHLGSSQSDTFVAVDPETSEYSLTATPVPDTIETTLNEVPVFVGWEYSSSLNAVVFDEDHTPETGDEVEITYTVLEGCDE